jgi:hypothetical protein
VQKWSRALASLLWKEKIKVFIYLILKSSNVSFRTNYPNTQSNNATIISLGIAWKERGYDSENSGTRITWFGVTVGEMWKKEILGPKFGFRKVQGASLENSRGSSELDSKFGAWRGVYV